MTRSEADAWRSGSSSGPQRAGGYYGTLAIHYDDGNVRYVILRGWSFEGGTQVAAGSVSGTWSQDKSPYFVGGDIQVPENGKLVIGPGVKVFFTGPYSLTVGKKAKLTAQGNAAQPIELTAWNRDAGWTGLRFVDSGSDDVLRYCSLSWAKKTAGFIPTESSGDAACDGAGQPRRRDLLLRVGPDDRELPADEQHGRRRRGHLLREELPGPQQHADREQHLAREAGRAAAGSASASPGRPSCATARS